MGLLRKTFIFGTGGLGRAVVNPNSKKARIMRASERQLRLEQAVAARDAAWQAKMLRAVEPEPPSPTAPVQAARDVGWYPDPSGRHMKRWWDGVEWTGRVIDPGGESSDERFHLG